MEKLRKIFVWIWKAKERLLLVVMVCFLCYRVYTVINPVPDDSTILPRYPSDSVSEDEIDIPLTPPRPPKDEQAESWRSLMHRNMFVFSLITSNSTSADLGDDYDIKLLSIQDQGNGKYRARIKEGNDRARSYGEGAKFSTYELIEIDPDTDCCNLYSEDINAEIEICVEEK